MTAIDEQKGEAGMSTETTGQGPKRGHQSVVRDVVDVIKEHPSIIRFAKYFGAYYIFLQLMGLGFIFFVFVKVLAAIDDHHDTQITLAQEIEDHIESMNEKFEDERERKRNDLLSKIKEGRRRMMAIKELVSGQQDFVEKAMIIMRDSREEDHVKFQSKWPELTGYPQALAQKAAWDIEKAEKEEKIRLRQEKRKIELQQEEERVQNLEKELNDIIPPSPPPSAKKKLKKKDLLDW